MTFLALASVVALVLGLAIGVPTGMSADAGPQHLSQENLNQYVQMVADSYALTNDLDLATRRLYAFPDYTAVIEQAKLSPNADMNAQVRLDFLKQALDVQAQNGIAPGSDSGGGGLGAILGVAVACILVVAVGGGGFLLLQRMRGGGGGDTSEEVVLSEAAQISAEASMTDYSESTERPVAQFMTTYILGDDLYDDSFSIDDAKGDFLGECGVGIGETIGVGDPKKVQTFEIWLFDKNDIRTVTSVLMSEHAFQDEELVAKLSNKGEPTLAEPGAVLTMETASLQVTARIVDMQYGSAPLPPNSFFQQVTIELAAFKRDGDGGGNGDDDFSL